MKEKIVVFFPTGNIAKFERYKAAFEAVGIEYRRYLQIKDENGALKDYTIKVDENCETARENAEKKARAYYDAYKGCMSADSKVYIMTTDEELHIDGIPKEEQPNLFVRRIQEPYLHIATDEEMVERYSKVFKNIAQRHNSEVVNAQWGYSLTLFGGNIVHNYNWIERVVFATEYKNGTTIPKGYPLNCMTFATKGEFDATKRLSELSPEEAEQYFSRYTNAVAKFVKDHINLELKKEEGELER